MINVSYSYDKHELVISGHAGYGKKGKDIVCAAASMIFYNLCEVLQRHKDEAFKEKINIEIKKGKNGMASVSCLPSSEYKSLIEYDFYFALIGYETLKSKYPNFINISVTGMKAD